MPYEAALQQTAITCVQQQANFSHCITSFKHVDSCCSSNVRGDDNAVCSVDLLGKLLGHQFANVIIYQAKVDQIFFAQSRVQLRNVTNVFDIVVLQ